MTIQAVFFDMGGTIETFRWTPEFRMRATPDIRKILVDAGIHLDLNDEQLYELISTGLATYHRLSLQTMQELPSSQVWSEYILKGYPNEHQKVSTIAEDLMLYIETHYYDRIMRPEIPAVLEAIRGMGLKIGLISNVNSRGQVTTNLEKYGIRHYFNPVVMSSVYGRRKPDPAIFHHAAWLAGVPTSHCLYVGDRVARDVLGARRAGFRLAIQIMHDFNHGETDDGATPDAVIRDMDELVDIIRGEISQDTAEEGAGPLRALIFDAGDVLYHRPTHNRKLAEFLASLGIAFDGIDRAKTHAIEQQAFRGQISRDQYREELLGMFGVTRADLVEQGKRALDEDDNDVVFFDGVCETLRVLKGRGYLLGIITDTAAPISVKLGWFERGGFGDVWDAIISSAEIGVRKPHPMMYQAALRHLGIAPDQAVFIGHKTCELEGARAVGMQTVAFNYDQDARADSYIERFSDLLDLPLLVEPASV